MSEKQMTETEAKLAYETAKVEHEVAVRKLRQDQLEYQLASEDRDRACDRYHKAEKAQRDSTSSCESADYRAKKAFIALGRVQIASRGTIG